MAATPSPSEAGGPVARVGFIGLGDMGGAIATRVIAAGFPMVLWARRREALDEFAGPGVEIAATPAELAAQVDLVGVCVWSDADVRAVLEGDDGVLAGCRPGTIVAVHSTIQPATCRELAAAAAERGAVLLDVPVSGGRDVALEGALVVAVAGDADAADRAAPVFASFGDPVLRLGPVGSGQFAKLINNAMLAANLAVADDALSLGDALGIDTDALAELLRHASGRSYALDVAVGVRASPEMRRLARIPLEKDIRQLLDEAAPDECAAATVITDAAEAALRRLDT
jgi:3-hydroxyisobutyrate dehydrogenase-like beta-hydroxyacid dehydrogenase